MKTALEEEKGDVLAPEVIDDERYDANVEQRWKMSPGMKILTGGWLTLFFDPVTSLILYGQKLFFVLLLPLSGGGAVGWILWKIFSLKEGFWPATKEALTVTLLVDITIAVFGVATYYLTLLHYYLHICGISIEFVYGLLGSIIFAAKKGFHPYCKMVSLILLLLGIVQMFIRFLRFKKLCREPESRK